jgi:lysyl-tRNA synthetase class I
MMISLDKFFVLELQNMGFDVDYSKLVEIYRASRKSPAYIARKADNKEIQEIMETMITREIQR